jgi:carbonyl reductase 1
MSESRIAVVTGATQGLGLAVASGLAARLEAGDLVLLTGRDQQRVTAAAAGLTGARARVEGRVLDVTEPDAPRRLAAELGEVHIVVSNASARMSPDRQPADDVDAVVETNVLGATRMLAAFLPILRPGGRFLVVASSFGTLGHLDERVRPAFDLARSLADVEASTARWRAAVHAGTAEELGWPHWLNVPSKVAQVAAVRAAAGPRREADLRAGTLLAAVCPGLIATDASRPWFTDMDSAQTPDQAAEALLELILADRVRPEHYGELVRFGAVLPWHGGVAAQTAGGVEVRRS